MCYNTEFIDLVNILISNDFSRENGIMGCK